MRTIFQIIFFITSSLVFAQSGSISYETISKKYKKSENQEINEYLKQTENSDFTIILDFNKICSHSYENIKITESNIGEKLLKILLDYKPSYYFSNEKTLYLDSEEVLIKKTINQVWNIATESKKIDNYLCYKATCVEKYIARDGNPKERTITAWFCPELPYSFGPLGYNGLPGLILELEKNENKVVAKSIVLSDEKTTIELPNKKIISEEEYNKKIKENFGY